LPASHKDVVNFQWKGGGYISNSDTKKHISKLLQFLLDGLSDMTKKDEYRIFIKLNEHFQYSDEVMAKIKTHNPAYTKLTTSNKWDRLFGRSVKGNNKGFKVKIAQNQEYWLYDISQTVGKAVPTIYQSLSGKVEHYQPIFDCLVKFSNQPVMFQSEESRNPNPGVWQDSFIENDKIVLRSGLSEQQIVFALVREIIKHNQTSSIAIEATSYIVCRHLNIDTSDFSFGYLLELLDFDVKLEALKTTAIQDAITNEAEVFIGYLNANLPFLQESASGSNSNSDSLEISENGTMQGTNIKDNIKQPNINAPNKNPYTKEPRTEVVEGIDFRIIKIIRNFMNNLPDKGIDMEAVRQYGYRDENMIPICNSVATQLFSKGREIYKLHQNNSEERIDSLEEISKHSGFFGISKEDWEIMQIQMAQSGLGNEVIKWNRLASATAKEIKEGSKAISASPTNTTKATPNANTSNIRQNTSRTNTESANIMKMLDYTADGSIIVLADDISHEEIENEVWLDTALQHFFDDTGNKPSVMPYFVNRKDYVISREMKKINVFMLHYCAYSISTFLNKDRAKDPDTGKPIYKVKKAVSDMRSYFSDRHISEALDKNRVEIKVPKSVKKAFEDCFEQLRKSPKVAPKKPTPDESIKRVTAKAESTAPNNVDQTATTEQSNQNTMNEHYAEIFHIIDIYNNSLKTKPKKQSQGMPKVPPLQPKTVTR